MTRIFLTRHGETEWNLQGRVQGSLDSALTERGRQQARFLAQRLRPEGVQYIYSSDLPRALATAEEIRISLGLSNLTVSPALREQSFGEWEGRVWAELREEYPDVFRVWDSEPHNARIPRGETMSEALNRAWAFFSQTVLEHPRETLCFVTHGLTLKLLVTKCLGYQVHDWDKTPWQHNTALNLLEYRNGVFTPCYLGDCSHLAS